MPLFGFLDPQPRMARRIRRDAESRVLRARKPLNDLLLLIVERTTECSNFAKSFIATGDPAADLVAQASVFFEYSALFCHLALEAGISKLSPALYLSLSEEIFLFVPLVIAESFFGGMKEPDKSACITLQRQELISRVGFLGKSYNSSKLVDLEKLIGLFLLVSDAVVRECRRESDWDKLRNPLMDKTIEQWKLASFDVSLSLIARNKRD